MTQSDIINNNFSKAFECIKCSNAYDTGEVLSEEKLFKQISERKHSTFDSSKFTIVGSPTIMDDGVASGFSVSDYITLPISLSEANSWQIILKNNSLYNNGYLLGGNILNTIAYIKGTFYISSNGTSWDVASNVGTVTDLPANSLIQLEFTGSKYISKYSTDNGLNWNITGELNSNVKITDKLDTLYVGVIVGGEPANCSIDLKHFSITVNGKEVFSGNKTGTDTVKIGDESVEIPYTLSKTGSKIVDVAYRDRVIDLYEQEGQAGYYTIDEPNKNFTLPMGEIYGMIGGSSSSTGGSGLELCDIGMALYVDETKGLRRRLNGSIMDITSNYQAFLTRLKEITTLYPSLVCTEEEWQTTKTMSKLGQCGKFVYNYGADGTTVTSIRLPLVININGLVDMSNAGLIKDESLPNVSHTHFTVNTSGTSSGGNGSNLTSSLSIARTGITGGWHESYSLQGTSVVPTLAPTSNNSAISSTYKDNAPVQQEAIQYPYFIQIATGQETENNIINDIELNNPFTFGMSQYYKGEMNNLSWLKSDNQWNSGAVYYGLYNWLLEKVNQLSYDSSKFVIAGNPTITDSGIASGFTSNDYVKTTNISYDGGGLETIEFDLTFTPSESQSHTTIFNSTSGWEILYTNDNTLEATNDSGQTCSVTTTESMVGKECKINFVSGSFFQQIEVTIGNNKYSGDEENHVSSENPASQLQIGTPINASNGSITSFKGSIDLSSLKITYNGSVVFSVGSVRKKVDGFKLSTDTDITDYDFVINTTDESFRLPLKNGDNIIFAPKEGSGSILETFTTSKANTWESSTLTAPVSGWYWTSGSGNITNSATRSMFLGKDDTDTSWQSARSVGPSGRNLETNHIWLNKGETFIVSSVEVKTRITYYIEADIPNLYYYVGETVQNANLIDAGRLGEQLAGKVNSSSLTECIAVVETYQNGSSWYRVYSDGWCEQGGVYNATGTYSFLKPFKDTNYCLTSGAMSNSEDTATYIRVSLYNRTSTGFSTVVGTPQTWQASGYIR